MLPITILIPTMNRPDYLQRALAYYREAGFDGCILIGDSSEGRPPIVSGRLPSISAVAVTGSACSIFRAPFRWAASGG
ncbi:hypothetical protein [Azospirillum sp. INR13]|uniref:hypothetical protein n=1 Tax=Azospirillum sp. INR13 TaxID=2596919 RepID=UPI0021050B67|nr:hypothetical protein [Azospirillum sp. INR13]